MKILNHGQEIRGETKAARLAGRRLSKGQNKTERQNIAIMPAASQLC
jgi:hypothetical protein